MFSNVSFCQGPRGDLGGPGIDGERGKRVNFVHVFHLEVKRRHSAMFSPVFTECVCVVIIKACDLLILEGT